VRVLFIGGAGYVGRLVLPHLLASHHVRVLDRRPVDGLDHVVGDATDPAVLAGALAGVDALVHAAMGSPAAWGTAAGAAEAFDVNVKSVHLALRAAHEAGVPHAVHVSSMSVYRDLTGRPLDESVPPDATDLYGLTKRLGEEVCRAAVAEWGLTVTALRLAWPTPDELWPDWLPPHVPDQPEDPRRTPDGGLVAATAASDVASALLAALEYRDGFSPFTISAAGLWSTERARTLLGWSPAYVAG
jgi:nucleoside-diphosphate-sugar epimerase